MAGLPVPVPYSWSVADVFTATIGNNTRDSLNFLLGPPVCIATQATVQSIPYQVWTPLSLDTTQLDPYGTHSNTVNNSRFTAPVRGWYTACGVASINANGTGARGARLQVNGQPVAGGCSFGLPPSSNASGIATPTRDILMNPGDYLEVASWQSSSGGAAPTGIYTDICTALWVRWSHS
ncbi:hypothetical protein [Kitasatospora mediocidica]|uniref:hypothetical protein n=1 Tax=Kitasatospora mediocidica TaxID=58352 RepID=UPI000568CC22|nr:hypothetical protein [Kitasatospora mediocidica]